MQNEKNESVDSSSLHMTAPTVGVRQGSALPQQTHTRTGDKEPGCGVQPQESGSGEEHSLRPYASSKLHAVTFWPT